LLITLRLPAPSEVLFLDEVVFLDELASIRDALDGHSRWSRSCRSFDIEWCSG
jgi:hypothetical protein